MAVTPLGEAPRDLRDRSEELHAYVELTPGTGYFVPVPAAVVSADVRVGANDRIPTAEVRLCLGWDGQGDQPNPMPRDWQVCKGGRATNPWEFLLGGRRIRVGTARGDESVDWIIFDGYIERLEVGWSGASKDSTRWARMFATSVALAADREPSQFVVGQWRRSRGAVMALRDVKEQVGQGEEAEELEAAARQCVNIAVPCIFNLHGFRNCDPTPLVCDDGSVVYVFCDVDQPDAEAWTVARILRYIQWAALQPPLPQSEATGVSDIMDQDRFAVTDGVLKRGWTSVDLRHWNLDALLRPYLEDASDDGVPGDAPTALNRVMHDIRPNSWAIEGMSVLEALALVADRANMLMSVKTLHTENGTRTGLHFAVRGYREEGGLPQRGAVAAAVVSAGGGSPSVSGGGPSDVDTGAAQPAPPAPHPGEPVEPPTRGVYIHCASDRAWERQGGVAAPIPFGAASACEGSLLIDESQIRPRVMLVGGPHEIEVTAELKPGWTPDLGWDVPSEDAVDGAVAELTSDAWARMYVPDLAAADAHAHLAGRLWVWNEDGAFAADQYRREWGPWSTDAAWDPVAFGTELGYVGLSKRGDNGWAPRRRPFKPTRASVGGQITRDVVVQLSFDGGAIWRYCATLQKTVLSKRAGIIFGLADLRTVVDSWQGDPGTGYSFAEAYIRGVLRVRVHACVEADDPLYVVRQPSGDAFAPLNWWELARTENVQRKLRFDPARPSRPVANSVYASDGPYRTGQYPNFDPLPEVARHAQLLQSELELRRFSGQFTIPWLWRDGHGPEPGYWIGDEVLGVRTLSAHTYLPMVGSAASRACSRIIGITWHYAAGEHSTTIEIEDRVYRPDDLVIPQDPASEGAY